MNLQNLTKSTRGGFNLRHALIPAPGCAFISADYSQIEPRVLTWIVEDTRQLDLIRGGMDVYEARARATGRYKGEAPLAEADPTLRQTMKIEGLGLQYRMGGARLHAMARGAGFDISLKQAKSLVRQFRRQNPGIVRLWNQLEIAFKRSRGSDFEITLPSGRALRYRNVVCSKGWKAENVLGRPPRFFHGGTLVENLVQAIAADILGVAILNLEDAGFPVVLHVHDEVLLEVDEPTAGNEYAGLLTEVETIMTDLPDWAEGLPVATEAQFIDHYTK